jgi:hypothetical protein
MSARLARTTTMATTTIIITITTETPSKPIHEALNGSKPLTISPVTLLAKAPAAHPLATPS